MGYRRLFQFWFPQGICLGVGLLDVSLSDLWELVKDREASHAVNHGVSKSRIRLSNWTELTLYLNSLVISPAFFNFPAFFNLNLNLAVRHSWSEPQSAPGLVFADYRVSPSVAAKNIINLISVLTIWWCPCIESSLVLLKEGVCYDQCVLLAKFCWLLPCFISYSKAKFACYSRWFLTSYFCIPVPYNDQRRQWHPTPVLLPDKSHGRRSLVGCSSWGQEETYNEEDIFFGC